MEEHLSAPPYMNDSIQHHKLLTKLVEPYDSYQSHHEWLWSTTIQSTPGLKNHSSTNTSLPDKRRFRPASNSTKHAPQSAANYCDWHLLKASPSAGIRTTLTSYKPTAANLPMNDWLLWEQSANYLSRNAECSLLAPTGWAIPEASVDLNFLDI